MLDAKRLTELYNLFVIREELPESELAGLTLEELTFVYASCDIVKGDEKYKKIHFPIRQKIFYMEALNRLSEMDEIYLAQAKTPPYPYIDPKGNAWLFSDLDAARKVGSMMITQQKMEIGIRKIEKSMLKPLMAQLITMGIEKILVDNGLHPMEIPVSDLFKEEESYGVSFNNGAVQRAMIQFFQFIPMLNNLRAETEKDLSGEEKKAADAKYSKAMEAFRLLESRMIGQLTEGKYLVPMVVIQDGERLAPGAQPDSSRPFSRNFSQIEDSQGNKCLPAFTDWTEFSRLYATKDWGALILSYDEIIRASEDMGLSIVTFNPKGCGLRLDKNLQKNVEAYRRRKAEIEKKRRK